MGHAAAPVTTTAISSGTLTTAQPAFTAEQVKQDPILKYFEYSHLPPHLQLTSIKFYELVCSLMAVLPRNAERTTALRKLLEAKDCAVRAALG